MDNLINENDDISQKIRNLSIQLMSGDLCEDTYEILTDLLQCMGEMELLVEITALRMKIIQLNNPDGFVPAVVDMMRKKGL